MSFFFFFNDTATTEIYTLSLHDALPISWPRPCSFSPPTSRATLRGRCWSSTVAWCCDPIPSPPLRNAMAMDMKQLEERSEEHTSELQSRLHLVCRLLLEKKKKLRTITQ